MRTRGSRAPFERRLYKWALKRKVNANPMFVRRESGSFESASTKLSAGKTNATQQRSSGSHPSWPAGRPAPPPLPHATSASQARYVSLLPVKTTQAVLKSNRVDTFFGRRIGLRILNVETGETKTKTQVVFHTFLSLSLSFWRGIGFQIVNLDEIVKKRIE